MTPWLFAGLIACFGTPTAPPKDAPVTQETVMTYPGTVVYRPGGGKPRAAVVVLHGSEGGRAPYAKAFAEQLAHRGFVTAAFCWFDCGSAAAPETLQRVPLDRTLDFVRWFHRGPAEDVPLVLYGASRGAEHAVLLGSLVAHAELFASIAAHAGSDTVVASYDRRTNAPFEAADGFEAAWTWKGEPQYGERALPWGSGPRIAIETYPGPLWLSHGEKDPLWPAARSQRLAEARARRPELKTELQIWPGEGHVVSSDVHAKAFLESLVAFVEQQIER